MFVRFYKYPDEKLREIFEKIIFVDGVKLNETPLVELYTEMFTRIVIFPIRSLSEIKDNNEYKEDVNLARKINIKATRKIRELRTQGNIFVMYPGGTRYRPWKPETKRGIKETTSYLNSFDYFCCSSINGNNMPPMEHENMTKEPYLKDVIVFNFGEVREAKKYINDVIGTLPPELKDDKDETKQAVVDKIVEDIDALHVEAEKYRSKFT